MTSIPGNRTSRFEPSPPATEPPSTVRATPAGPNLSDVDRLTSNPVAAQFEDADPEVPWALVVANRNLRDQRSSRPESAEARPWNASDRWIGIRSYTRYSRWDHLMVGRDEQRAEVAWRGQHEG